jgi:16S rRNA (guanine(966)-N(2))-methyltransferase RsmD
LPVPDAQGLRPTPDRVRETVFNWINHLIDGAWEPVACLDLFAGTGALGFEAASRGAGRVVMVEFHTPAVQQLQATKDKLAATQVDIVRADAAASVQGMLARGMQRQFTLIFLDPPYGHDWLARILPDCGDLLAPGGLIYAESETALDTAPAPPWLSGWDIVRADSAGMVHYYLLQRKIA